MTGLTLISLATASSSTWDAFPTPTSSVVFHLALSPYLLVCLPVCLSLPFGSFRVISCSYLFARFHTLTLVMSVATRARVCAAKHPCAQVAIRYEKRGVGEKWDAEQVDRAILQGWDGKAAATNKSGVHLVSWARNKKNMLATN